MLHYDVSSNQLTVWLSYEYCNDIISHVIQTLILRGTYSLDIISILYDELSIPLLSRELSVCWLLLIVEVVYRGDDWSSMSSYHVMNNSVMATPVITSVNNYNNY